MIVLAIESSCDETAVAVVETGPVVRSSVVATQIEMHAPFGGVVPEIASRAHVEMVKPIFRQALVEANIDLAAIDVFAATHGPGLSGALIVGVAAAKALALATAKPYIGVNHHEGHLFAAMLEDPSLEPPFLTLIVSGGHTMIVGVDAIGSYRILGRTVDDAAGEAFDKVARYCGLGYPGGPIIDRLAMSGDPTAVRLPRPMLDDGLDFSFSGLKTAVVRYINEHPEVRIEDLAAGFQAAVTDVLVTKLFRAAHLEACTTIVIGGGVAANSALRTAVRTEALERGLHAVIPSRTLCTDNAAMIGAAALGRLADPGELPVGARRLAGGVLPNLRLG